MSIFTTVLSASHHVEVTGSVQLAGIEAAPVLSGTLYDASISNNDEIGAISWQGTETGTLPLFGGTKIRSIAVGNWSTTGPNYSTQFEVLNAITGRDQPTTALQIKGGNGNQAVFHGKISIDPAASAATVAGESATIGYSSTEGVTITGQGSTNDVTIRNDNDSEVIGIPTGTQQVSLPGGVVLVGNDAAGSDRKIIFGHDTVKSVIGIDDSQKRFQIRTQNSGEFHTDGDFEMDTSGNVHLHANLIMSGGEITAPVSNQTLKLYSAKDVNINIDSNDDGIDAYFRVQRDNQQNILQLDETGHLHIEDGLRVDGNAITGSDGDLKISWAGNDDVTVAGKLLVGGNQIKNSADVTELTFSNIGTTVAGTLTLTNNQINGSAGTIMTFRNDADNAAGTVTELAGKLRINGNAIQNSSNTELITLEADGVKIPDDKKLYFGADGDGSFEYDEDGQNVVLYAGAPLRITDDVNLEFGTTGPGAGGAALKFDQAGTDRLILTSPDEGTVVDGHFAVSGSTSIEPSTSRSTDDFWIKIAEVEFTSNSFSSAVADILVNFQRRRYNGVFDNKSAIIHIENECDGGAIPIFTVDLLNLSETGGASGWSKEDFVLTYSTFPFEAQIWVKAPQISADNTYRAFASMLGGSRKTANDVYAGGWKLMSNSVWAVSVPSLGADVHAQYSNKRYRDLAVGTGEDSDVAKIALIHTKLVPNNAVIGQDSLAINFDTTDDVSGDGATTMAQLSVEAGESNPTGGSISSQMVFKTRLDGAADTLVDGLKISKPFTSYNNYPLITVGGGMLVGDTSGAQPATVRIRASTTMAPTKAALDVSSNYTGDFDIQQPVAYFTGDTSYTAAQGVVEIRSTDTAGQSGDVTLKLRQDDPTPTSSGYHWAAYTTTTLLGGYSYTGVVTPFTGMHYTQLDGAESYTPGTIMKSTGEVIFEDPGSAVDNAWVKSTETTTAKEPGVVGVYSVSCPGAGGFDDAHGYNAVGEGKVLVTDEGGDISIGDYICSSNRAGHGMKQDDDLLHNYTVAKALTTIDWSSIDADPELGFKRTLLACTYHCG